MDQAYVLQAKELRANIVESLYRHYGTDISIRVLKGSIPMGGFLTETELKKALYYLGGEGKRYVKLVLNEDDYLASLVWLTPAGVNLAEGDLEDVGVDLYE